MKQVIVAFFVIISYQSITAQIKNDRILVSIDDKEYTIRDFRRVYEKNLDVIQDEDSKNIDKNLELFINYNLKVKEAYNQKLDTASGYKKEIEGYRNQLSAPYLQDSAYINKLIEEAYYRLKNEIKVKHILIRLSKNATANDTLKAYKKISKIRDSILKGKSFEYFAVKYSDDPSAKPNANSRYKGNKGNLGYFSGFKMVYPFEEAAYTTKLGEISEPFRTRFGYHIVQVDDIRKAKGDVEVAHILISDKTKKGEELINEIYSKLDENQNFKALARKYSEDNQSKSRGGKLRKFGTGTMIKEFEEVAFSLENENEYSKPFLTQYGWHIVQLIKKYPIKDFKEIELELRRRVNSGERAQLSKKAVSERLKEKYSIIENENLNEFLNSAEFQEKKNIVNDDWLLKINDSIINKSQFINFLKKRSNKPIFDLYKDFKEKIILDYYKENLEKSEPEFAKTIQEYRNGLLIFELMQKDVWQKSIKDTLGLQKFYEKNKVNYKSESLEDSKGLVISDYQQEIEKEWMATLRKKSDITINKRSLTQLKRYYNNEK